MLQEEQPYEIIIEQEDPDKPNIEVDIESDNIKVTLNGYRLFSTMAMVEPTLVALNEKIKELIQKHLEEKAGNETSQRNGR